MQYKAPDQEKKKSSENKSMNQFIRFEKIYEGRNIWNQVSWNGGQEYNYEATEETPPMISKYFSQESD